MMRLEWMGVALFSAASLASPAALAQEVGPGVTEAVPTPSNDPPVDTLPNDEEIESLSFIKGELAYVGTRELLSRFDHVGVQIGPSIIAGDFFASVDPGAAFYGDGWAASLHLPLNLLLVENGSLDYGGLRVREQDWDEPADFTRVIRFFTIGRKEEPLYFTVNSLRPTTIGQGTLIDKYQGNIDVDRHVTGVELDAYNNWGGFQFQLNDITLQNQVVGGVAFIKPLGFFSDGWFATGLSLGVEYAADFRAPRCVLLNEDSTECVQANGHSAGVDPFTGALLDNTFVRSDRETGRYAVDETTVQAVGFSGEMKVYRDASHVDVKLYGTYHAFVNEGGGGGATTGVLARLNSGDRWRNAFRLKGEYRTFGNGFLPSYFDTTYEISKFQSFYQPSSYQVTPTRFQRVFGDLENGFEREELDRRHGFNVEFSYGLFKNKRRNKQLAIAVGLADSTGPADSSFYAHVEFPALEFLQVFGSFIRTNEESISDLFGSGMFESENGIVLSGLRLQVLPFFFINAHFSRTFAVTRSPGQEFRLGDDSIVDVAGSPSPVFQQDQLFENVSSFFVKAEFGWEFDESNEQEVRAGSGVDDEF
ncbi:MAG: hypothetical protein AAF658_06110 [Myxococcota bacterium]